MASLARIGTKGGIGFQVNPKYAPQFQALLNDLEASGYGIGKNSGGYNYRTIAGTNRLSNHAFGNAIDLNWDRNARGTRGDIPADLARQLAKKHGLAWGGDWKNPDPMHFEVAGATTPHAHGAQSMPTYKDVGGQVPQMAPGSSPADVAYAQRMAQMLMAGGQGTPRHWAEALGNAMQTGVGALWAEQATKGQRGQQEASNQALAAILSGADPTQFVGDPNVGKFAAQQWASNRDWERGAQQRQMEMDLKRAQIDAQRAKIASLENQTGTGGPQFGGGNLVKLPDGSIGIWQQRKFGPPVLYRMDESGQPSGPVTPDQGMAPPETNQSRAPWAPEAQPQQQAPAAGGGGRAEVLTGGTYVGPDGVVRQKLTGAPVIDLTKGIAERKGMETEASKLAEISATERAQARVQLPKAQLAAVESEEMVRKLKGHPGRKWGLGWGAKLWSRPAGPARAFDALHEQFKNTVFLEARQMLKGGGAITDFEGKKAEAAKVRMDQAQSEKDYFEALDDWEKAVRRGLFLLESAATGKQLSMDDIRKAGNVPEAGAGGTGGGWSAKRLQ